MEEVLTPTQIQQFIQQGFIRIDNAFSPETAAEVRRILWKDMGLEAGNPAGWTKPVIRLGMYSQPPFIEAANTPVLHAAFDQLIGPGRWISCKAMGTFPIRFPSPDDPGDAGWHIDVSFPGLPGTDPANFMEWRANWYSKGRGLLMLFLFSDVGEQDAPTRIRIGSHLDLARVLKQYGEQGLSLLELAEIFPLLPVRQEVLATGKAGTVYLCHPFLVHAAQPHTGVEPRFLAQPPLLLQEDLMQGDRRYLVEQAIQLALS
jgi:hypothetical protein